MRAARHFGENVSLSAVLGTSLGTSMRKARRSCGSAMPTSMHRIGEVLWLLLSGSLHQVAFWMRLPSMYRRRMVASYSVLAFVTEALIWAGQAESVVETSFYFAQAVSNSLKYLREWVWKL